MLPRRIYDSRLFELKCIQSVYSVQVARLIRNLLIRHLEACLEVSSPGDPDSQSWKLLPGADDIGFDSVA